MNDQLAPVRDNAPAPHRGEARDRTAGHGAHRGARPAVFPVVGILALVALLVPPPPGSAQEEPKTPRMACGQCAEGSITTGRTTDAKICPEDDHVLVECVPPGRVQMSVCGSCPSGYIEIGRSHLPSLCGSEDGGLRTHCQLPKLEGGMPDPTQGGRRCPPDCGGNLPPGLPPDAIDRPGKLPPPPKVPE
jgi:hypothetical protein